jgi:hypothetical protein
MRVSLMRHSNVAFRFRCQKPSNCTLKRVGPTERRRIGALFLRAIPLRARRTSRCPWEHSVRAFALSFLFLSGGVICKWLVV